MAQDASFDVVSKVDRQEVDNALHQAAKEIEQRYDFKGVGASIEWSGDGILMRASSEDRVQAVLDVFQSKLARRDVSLKALKHDPPQASGKEYRIVATLQQGIPQEAAKKLTALIRDRAPKSVRAQIQGEELRVSSKSRNDLQETIALLKEADVDVALQFVNYR